MNKWVTVRTALRSNELEVAKSYLEEHDIRCFLKNELMGDIHPTVEVELQVQKKDVSHAISLLIDGDFITTKDFVEYSDPLTRFVNRIFSKLRKKQ